MQLQTEAGGGVTLKLPHSPICLVVRAGFCLELQLGLLARIATHGLSLWLELPDSIVARFPGQISQEREPGDSCLTFDNLVLEVTVSPAF